MRSWGEEARDLRLFSLFRGRWDFLSPYQTLEQPPRMHHSDTPLFVSASDLIATRETLCFWNWETNILLQAKSRQPLRVLWGSRSSEAATINYYRSTRFAVGKVWALDIGHVLWHCVRNLWRWLSACKERHRIHFLANFTFSMGKHSCIICG